MHWKKWKKSYLTFAGIITFIVGWSILLSYIPPSQIVERVGANNSLIAAFLISTFGGVSTATSVNYYATVVTLAAGGANPILLGIAAGCGITIGDSLFYYLGTKGHDVLTGRPKRWADKISNWIKSKREHVVQVFAYLYTGLTPLPNDILTVSLGLAEYSYRRLLPALLLGNITLTLIIAEFAARSQLIQQIFGI